jgi:aspartate-semialdehyde dehydrogenase
MKPFLSNVAIVGASGLVGSTLLELLEKRNFPIKHLRCFASSNSQGKTCTFKNKMIPIEVLSTDAFANIDLAFFCTEATISKAFVPAALNQGAKVIDCSSYYRLDPNIPLIVPEITLDFTHQLVASPNCIATIISLILAPLNRAFGIKRVIATTYQAASGGGRPAMSHLIEETRAQLLNQPFTNPYYPFQYAFNVFLHNSTFYQDGYVEEEKKIIEETKKILRHPTLLITATSVRVPVLRCHSVSLNIECNSPPIDARAVLICAPGVKVVDPPQFPMPIDAEGKEEVFCGRIRTDISQKNTLEIWVVGDQLLKGAALNAVQIAECWIQNFT